MNAAVPDSMRSAALTLHALPEEDRRWMLRALSQADGERLAPLLQELQSLGIPRDASLLAHLQRPATKKPAWPEALDPRRVDALLQVLAGEPSGVAHKLLSLRAWKWAPTLLAGMGDAQQPEVRPHGAKFEAALLDLLERHAQARPADDMPAATGSVWRRAGRLLTRKGSTP